MRRTPPLIVGGGPAGAAAAIALGRAGISALILDRNRTPPDQLCGGFLGWDALASLKALGIDAGALGAVPVTRMRVVAGNTIVEAPLPRSAAGLSRRTLDAALLAQAGAAGAEIRRGTTVRQVDAAALTVRLADAERSGRPAEPIAADAIFLATGKHDLAGSSRPRFGREDDPPMGTRARLGASPALASALAEVIELHLFPGGYAGLLLQEDGAANLCLSCATSLFQAIGRDGLVPLVDALSARAPRLAERVQAATSLSPSDFVARVPYGWRATETAPGLFRIGDQAAVIASLAGDGIAIALASGTLAARRYLEGGADAAPSFQREFARTARRPIAVAEALRHRAERPSAGAWLAGLGHLPGLPALLARLTRIGTA